MLKLWELTHLAYSTFLFGLSIENIKFQYRYQCLCFIFFILFWRFSKICVFFLERDSKKKNKENNFMVLWIFCFAARAKNDAKICKNISLFCSISFRKMFQKKQELYVFRCKASRFNQLHYVRRENHHLLPNPMHVSRQISQSPRNIPNSPRKKYFPTSRRATTTAAPVIPNQHISRRFNQQSLSQIKKKLSQTPTTCSLKTFPSTRGKILSNPQQRRTLPKQQRSTLPKHLPTHKKNKNKH